MLGSRKGFVPHEDRQYRKNTIDVSTGANLFHEWVNGKGMPQVVDTWTTVIAYKWNACHPQYFPEPAVGSAFGDFTSCIADKEGRIGI